jgi:hypothetical protein
VVRYLCKSDHYRRRDWRRKEKKRAAGAADECHGVSRGGLIRCSICGKFCRPNRKSRTRQKCCARKECQAERKAKSQKDWHRKNPDYFRGRYPYLLEWRKKHPDYQRQLRKKRASVCAQPEIQDLEPGSGDHNTVTLLKKPVLFSVPVSEIQGEIQDLEKYFGLNCTVILRGYSKLPSHGTGVEIQDELAPGL